ncbi:O-antigen polymerase [Edwardsiella tarda]|uniref:O-antigen polymerase n=1 Tax=Edwardsiella tarda TaxID=636 RepID=UPI00156213B8|nr:O-antigen polymerase [Edwardsiella tarda]
MFVWLFPLGCYLIFPFELDFKPNYFYVFIILFSIIIMMTIDKMFHVRRVFYSPCVTQKDILFFKLMLIISLISFPLTVYDFLSRGVDFLGSVGNNRDIYTEHNSGFVSQLALFFMAFGLLSFFMFPVSGYMYDKYKWKIIFILLIMVFFSLIVGNRQIINVIFISIALKSIDSFKIRFFSKYLLFFLFIISVLLSFVLWFQFERQSFVSGGGEGQVDFLLKISNMKCVSDVLCGNASIIPLAYIFQYYGNEYHGITAVIESNADMPIFSQTLPVLYRRFSDFLMLPSYQQTRDVINGLIEAKYNMFPRFWRTMYAQIYLDFGWIGFALFNIFITMAMIINRVKYFKYGRYVNYVNYHYILFFMVFGIMFFPLIEPIQFFSFILLIIYNIYSHVRVGNKKVFSNI